MVESREVVSQKHMINLMLRQGYYMCSHKSGFITNDYMQAVRYGNIHCPLTKGIKLRACPDPPCKADIVDALLTEAANYKEGNRPKPLNLGFTRESKCFPDKLWLLHVLSTLNSEHRFFQRDYMPPPKPVKNQPLAMDNFDGLFTGINPLLSQKYMKQKKPTKRAQNSLARAGVNAHAQVAGNQANNAGNQLQPIVPAQANRNVSEFMADNVDMYAVNEVSNENTQDVTHGVAGLMSSNKSLRTNKKATKK